MSKKYLIGVDLGTSGTKAALYDVDGRLIAEASLEVPIYYPKPGVVEQENDDFYRTAAETVRRCMEQSGIDLSQVAAIAFDSQMAGIGSVDADFRPAARFDSWLDMRCQPYIQQMDRDAGDLVTDLTGCAPTCDHGPKILWWKHERPEEYARIHKFVTPAGYVAGSMCGLKGDQAFMDYTFIHFGGCTDSANLRWDADLAGKVGMDIGKMPEIVAPWKVIGEVTEAAARDFGLAPGTPVAAGCGDTAACALGAGVVREGMVYDTAGTAAVLAATTTKLVADKKHRALLSMHSVIPGLYHPLAYIAGGGIALRWFRDQFYNTFRGKAQPIESDMYAEMIEMAASVAPGADGLMFSPHLGGRICPSAPAMRGAWTGFSWGHTQAHFFRAVLESVAFEYGYYLRVLADNLPGAQMQQARVVGGGAKSAVWNQIKADVLGIPYQRLQRTEFGTWGSAMIAGKAVGLFDDLQAKALESAQPAGDPICPDAERSKLYQPLVDQYIRMQSSLAEMAAR